MTRAIALALAVLGLAGGCFGGSSGVDRDEYVDANRAILDQLPRFPGLEPLEELSAAYRVEENGPIVGYGTVIVVKVPNDAGPGDVLAYYRKHLASEWELTETLDGPVLNYRRGDASASINLESWRGGEMEIAVDHRYFANRHF